MRVDVKVPALSEWVAEATLLSWHKKEGEHVERDENLIDVETDKVVMELPAPAAGILAKIIKGDGTTVAGGEVIATIDTEAGITETEAAPTEPQTAPANLEASPVEAEIRPVETAAGLTPSRAEPAPAPSSAATPTRVMMPAAQKLAEQAN